MERARAIRSLLLAEVEQATTDEMLRRPGSRYSARDVLVHVGNWEEEAVRWLPYMLRGEPVPQMEPKSIDEINAEMLARYDHLDVAGAVGYLADVRTQLEDLAEQITHEQWQCDRSFLGVLIMCPDHEIAHLHQLREALAAARGDAVEAAVRYLRYTRQRVLVRVNPEFRSADALTWRPPDGKWTTREILIHLAVWDRFAAYHFSELAAGRPAPPMPFPEGGLDAWNQAQVDAGAWMTLTDILAELGAAREALEAALRRLTPEQLAGPDAQSWLEYRQHDEHHMHQILARLQGWRASQG